MTTLYTHAAVGLGLARLATGRPMPWRYWGLAAVLPAVPDLDVFSMASYGSLWGHRGITHSLVFALGLGGIAAAATCRRFKISGWTLRAIFFVIVASHPLLDACTRGGGNVPLFWPLGGMYGNWGRIPVSDIAFELPDPRTRRAVRAELLWVWLPLTLLVGVVWAARRSKRRRNT